jgi:hypothetical protein
MHYVLIARKRGLNLHLPPGARRCGKIHAYEEEPNVGEPIVSLCGQRAVSHRCDFPGNPLPNRRWKVCKRCLPAIEAETVGKILAERPP